MQRQSGGVSDLASRFIDDNIALWRRYAEGLRRATVPVTSSDRADDTAAGDLTGRALDIVHVSVGHYANLLRTYADFASQLVVEVLPQASSQASDVGAASKAGERSQAPVGAESPGSAPTPTPTPATIELTFSAASGETATQAFAVANRKSEDLEVTFELTEFVSEDGSRRFRAPVMFAPDSFVLPPGAEQVVECRIPIGEVFAPGSSYAAMVRVPGFPHVQTLLIVVPRRSEKAVAAKAAPPSRTAAAPRAPKDRRSPPGPRRPSRRAK